MLLDLFKYLYNLYLYRNILYTLIGKKRVSVREREREREREKINIFIMYILIDVKQMIIL